MKGILILIGLHFVLEFSHLVKFSNHLSILFYYVCSMDLNGIDARDKFLQQLIVQNRND